MADLFPGLAENTAMQSRPLGMRLDPAALQIGREYRRQQSDFNLARRMLRREARQGNVGAAGSLLSLGRAAQEEGVDFGGIRDRDTELATVKGLTEAKKRDLNRLQMDATLDDRYLERALRDTDPVARPAPGSQPDGTKVRILDAPESFADTERRKRAEATAAGAFGNRTTFTPSASLSKRGYDWWRA